jgi:hypothetical protein
MRLTFNTGADLRGFAFGLGLFLFLLGFSLLLGFVQVIEGSIRKAKRANRKNRRKLLARLGVFEEAADGSDRKTIVGFFHPYW